MIRNTIEIEELLMKVTFLREKMEADQADNEVRQMIFNRLVLNEKILKWVMGEVYSIEPYLNDTQVMPFMIEVNMDLLAMMMDSKEPEVEDELERFRKLDIPPKKEKLKKVKTEKEFRKLNFVEEEDE